MIHYLPRSTRESLRSLDSPATMKLPLLVFILFAAYLLNVDRLLVIGLVNGLDSPGVWQTLWQRIHRFGDHRQYAVPLPAANWSPPPKRSRHSTFSALRPLLPEHVNYGAICH